MHPIETTERVAQGVRQALEQSASRDGEALRIAFGFVAHFDHAHAEERVRLVERRPPSTGDARYDALLAALVEHLCAKTGTPIPAWVEDPERFIEPWWFVSGLSRLHASALVQSPISFARRGVFICDGALACV